MLQGQPAEPTITDHQEEEQPKVLTRRQRMMAQLILLVTVAVGFLLSALTLMGYFDEAIAGREHACTIVSQPTNTPLQSVQCNDESATSLQIGRLRVSRPTLRIAIVGLAVLLLAAVIVAVFMLTRKSEQDQTLDDKAVDPELHETRGSEGLVRKRRYLGIFGGVCGSITVGFTVAYFVAFILFKSRLKHSAFLPDIFSHKPVIVMQICLTALGTAAIAIAIGLFNLTPWWTLSTTVGLALFYGLGRACGGISLLPFR